MIFPVCKACIIAVLVGNGTVINPFVTAIADIGSFVQSIAALFYIIFAGLIAGRAGGIDTTENDLVTGIRFFTVIAMDAKIMSIIKCALMIPST
jgi:hypothetical protein